MSNLSNVMKSLAGNKEKGARKVNRFSKKAVNKDYHSSMAQLHGNEADNHKNLC